MIKRIKTNSEKGYDLCHTLNYLFGIFSPYESLAARSKGVQVCTNKKAVLPKHGFLVLICPLQFIFGIISI